MGVQIRKMFDKIAKSYDILNHVLSAGRDIVWRKRAVKLISDGRSENRVVDICGGTGDFLQEYIKKNSKSSGLVGDFAREMLAVSTRKYNHPVFQLDAMRLPFKDGAADVALNGFGMRNLDSTTAGIEEVYRVLNENGIFVTLEFFRPETFLSRLFYFGIAPLFIPLVAAVFRSKMNAYSYLVRSIQNYKSVSEYKKLCLGKGFKSVNSYSCDFGIAYIVVARKGA